MERPPCRSCICGPCIDGTPSVMPVILCMHVHFNLLVCVICTPVSIKLCFFSTQTHIDTNGNNITAAGGATIERRRGGCLIRVPVPRRREGQRSGPGVILMASRKEGEEVNAFQSLITLSWAKCGGKLSVGRSQTSLQFDGCFMDPCLQPTQRITLKNPQFEFISLPGHYV